jgi:arylsulfatase A-like enzyme
MTGRIPIRSALSIVVAPGDENALKKETPTIAEFFQKNGYSTYFSENDVNSGKVDPKEALVFNVIVQQIEQLVNKRTSRDSG